MALVAQEARQNPLPKPTGESAVGRTQFDWTDEPRANPENQSGHRRVYPSEYWPYLHAPSGTLYCKKKGP